LTQAPTSEKFFYSIYITISAIALKKDATQCRAAREAILAKLREYDASIPTQERVIEEAKDDLPQEYKDLLEHENQAKEESEVAKAALEAVAAGTAIDPALTTAMDSALTAVGDAGQAINTYESTTTEANQQLILAYNTAATKLSALMDPANKEKELQEEIEVILDPALQEERILLKQIEQLQLEEAAADAAADDRERRTGEIQRALNARRTRQGGRRTQKKRRTHRRLSHKRR
jgi:hypothetical protein